MLWMPLSTNLTAMSNKWFPTHRQLLQRNPENWQLLRMYAKFLEFIRNDPWGAAKNYA